MRAHTIAVIALAIAVLGLGIVSMTRPVPTAKTPSVYRAHDSAASFGGSAYGGTARQRYPDCTFDGNPANDKPNACPPWQGQK